MPRSTPDYFTLQVLNTILGGSFTSRLNQNLREDHGYTYGASSRFDMRLAPASFAAGAGVPDVVLITLPSSESAPPDPIGQAHAGTRHVLRVVQSWPLPAEAMALSTVNCAPLTANPMT